MKQWHGDEQMFDFVSDAVKNHVDVQTSGNAVTGSLQGHKRVHTSWKPEGAC